MSCTPDEGSLKVNVASDGSQAELVITQGCPVELLNKELCHSALAQASVELTGSVIEAVDQMLSDYPGDAQRFSYVVCQAAPPVHGEDGRIEWLIDQAPDPLQALENQPDQESHYEKSSYTFVQLSHKLARIIEPTAGLDGRDVCGRTLDAQDGKPCEIHHDESILKDADGMLVAQSDGVLVRDEEKICIRQMIMVDDYVDFSTGNIEFVGDVIVKKGVRDCFVIKAGGNVDVHGLIEAATIECGGDLIAHGGFAGRDQGTVMVRGNLLGKYLDNIQGKIGGDLRIEREVINCEFQIEGDINSPCGSVIGGRHIVTMDVVIATLGSPAGVTTELIIGTVPHLDSFVVQLEPYVDQYVQQHQVLQAEHDMLNNESARLTAKDKERQTKIIFKLAEINQHLHKAKNVYSSINNKINQQRTINITVHRTLHAGTVLNISGVAYRIKTDVRGPLHIYAGDHGDIVYSKGDNPAGDGGILLNKIASVQWPKVA